MSRTPFIIMMITASCVDSQTYISNPDTLAIPGKLVDELHGVNDSGWKATLSPRFETLSWAAAKTLCGVREQPASWVANISTKNIVASKNTPKTFDSRDKWPGCIGSIVDQGACGSCWAVAAAEAISDRLCIGATKHKFAKRSALDLISCDFRGEDMGCLGGVPADAWSFAAKTGLATDACLPYAKADGGPIPPCANGTNPCYASVATPLCPSYCTKGMKAVDDDRVKIKEAYKVPADAASIQTAIMTAGPVEASFYVYQDFLAYSNGTYKHVTGENIGKHAIKIIGWGEEAEAEYWLVMNSWGLDWGDHGLFKIKRGTNECGIEAEVVAGDVA